MGRTACVVGAPSLPSRHVRRLPHPLVLLLTCLLVGAAATWILPAGRYERREDPATGRRVVVAGTYRLVDPAPVTPFHALVAIPRGLADASGVVFLVLLVGGAFTVVDRTGALARGVDTLARALRGREALVVPIACVVFATGGMLQGMQEEVIPLVPVLVLLVRRFGHDPLVAVAMSAGSAIVGGAFSPINPFGVGIAQRVAQLPLLSGAAFRMVVLLIALVLWTGAVMRMARRTRVSMPIAGRGRSGDETSGSRAPGVPPRLQVVAPEAAEQHRSTAPATGGALGRRGAGVFLIVLGAFAVYVAGAITLDWEFDEMSAVFVAMALLAGLVGGLGVGGTAAAYLEGFREMAGAAMLIGIARAIFVVLDDGRIIDTIVHALVTPLETLPTTVAAIGMLGVHAAIHVPVPSTSGQAVLTMPILAPLSDLIGLSRQVAVFAYQVGAGLCDMITPTNGAIMAILAAAGVPYERWLKFCFAPLLLLFAIATVAIAVGIAMGLK